MGSTVANEATGNRVPRVSIGLAVYNGEPYLREAIDSILAQTYKDFELIISDNASTDATADICKEYAARDPRIRYSRNPTNIGGANNENLTFKLARGQYFRWAAHDDVCAPTLIERCVEVLDKHPEVVLCHCAMVSIDESGKQMGVSDERQGTAARPHQRFSELSYRRYTMTAIYGVIRSEVLRRTRLMQNYTSSDRVLLCELALYGPFIQVPEPLFYKRFHSGNVYKDWRGRMAWFLPELQSSGSVTFPHWLELFDYLQTVRRVPLPWAERQLCRLCILRWVLYHAKNLAKDMSVAAYLALHSRSWRAKWYADVERWQ